MIQDYVQKYIESNKIRLSDVVRMTKVNDGTLYALMERRHKVKVNIRCQIAIGLNIKVEDLIEYEVIKNNEFIYYFREKLGISKEELAEHIDRSVTTLMGYEKNTSFIDFNLLDKILTYLQVSDDDKKLIYKNNPMCRFSENIKDASNGEKLKRMRVDRGLSLTDVSEMTGIPVNGIWRIENSKNTRISNIRYSLIKALNPTEEELDELDENMLAYNIYKYRMENEITEEEFAEMIGLTYKSYRAYVVDCVRMPKSTSLKIKELINLSDIGYKKYYLDKLIK